MGEPVADFEGFVGEVAGFPDGEAGRVAVPGVVGDRDVPHVVDFFAGVVVVDVFAVAFEVVAAVFYTPEPGFEMSLKPQCCIVFQKKDLHVVAVEADADFVALPVTGIVTTTDVVVSSTGDTCQIEDLDYGTSCLWV